MAKLATKSFSVSNYTCTTRLYGDYSISGVTATITISYTLQTSTLVSGMTWGNYGGIYIDGTNYGTYVVPYDTSEHTMKTRTYTLNVASGATVSASAYTVYGWAGLNESNSKISGSFSIPAQYTAPSGVSGSNQASDGTPQKAYSKVSVSNWGTNCSADSTKPYMVYLSDQSTRVYYGTSQYGYWTNTTASTSPSACAITVWYPRARNNQQLNSWGSAVYLAAPSAPSFDTITGVTTTSPSMTVTGSVRYTGGTPRTPKETTLDSGTMKNWRIYYKKTSDSSYTQAQSSNSSNKSFTFNALPKTNFETGYNYNLQIKATNTIGGTGINTTTIYCPTGVSGTVPESSKTTTSLVVNASTNYAGSTTAQGGSMACYEVKWSPDKTTVDGGGGTSTGLQTNSSFNITGLGNGQTIYYRVYGWNSYGLSNVSSTLSAQTIPRYDPTFSSVTTTPLSPGGTVAVKVAHTGGLTIDELPVTSITLKRKPSSSNSWTTLKTATGLNITAGQTYTFTNAWTTDVPSAGNFDFRITLSNGTDTNDYTFTIQAPTSVSLINVTPVTTCPTQLKATAVTSTINTLYKYTFQSVGGGTTRTKTFNSSATTYTAMSSNSLLFDTTYLVTVKAYDGYGLWRESDSVSVTTDKRVEWFYCTANSSSRVESTLRKSGVNKNITEVYHIVKNALGNISNGTNMNGKRLYFPSGKLYYRPENVATITFTNNKQLAFKLEPSSETYKFGIWSGNTLQTTFFDGSSWLVTSYDFPNGYTVSSITSTNNMGLNSSSAFSTTALVSIPAWESGSSPSTTLLGTVSSAPYRSGATSTTVVVVDYYADGHAEAKLLFSATAGAVQSYYNYSSYGFVVDNNYSTSFSVPYPIYAPANNVEIARINFSYDMDSAKTYSCRTMRPSSGTGASYQYFDFDGEFLIPKVRN